MSHYTIYHQVKEGVDCPDGVAAAWVVKRKFPETMVLGCTYDRAKADGDNFPFIAGDQVVIVDFSFPSSIISKWIEKGVEVLLIDHHKTALEDLAGFSDRVVNGYKQVFDMAECGATLAWKHLFLDEQMPYFLNHVRDRDLWDFLLPQTEFVHEALATLRYRLKEQNLLFGLFDGLATLDKEALHKFLAPIGEPLVLPRQEKVADIAMRFKVLQVPGTDYHVPTVRLAENGSEDRYTSDVCMRLYRGLPSAPFVACITSDGSWSLRSDKHGNNTDVGAIAKSLGGGGHRNAAGFSIASVKL